MTYRPVCDNFKKCFFFGFNTAIMLQVLMYIYTCTDHSAFLIYFCFLLCVRNGKKFTFARVYVFKFKTSKTKLHHIFIKKMAKTIY